MAPTPDWAVFGSEHAGFDPSQQRVKKASGDDGVWVEHKSHSIASFSRLAVCACRSEITQAGAQEHPQLQRRTTKMGTREGTRLLQCFAQAPCPCPALVLRPSGSACSGWP
jgi:hypothetical protein